MKEKLIQYVDLLFTGAANCEDIKQEILQNTLDRYDDLIAEGKIPEAAYRLAITGIGDINEILGARPLKTPGPHSTLQPKVDEDTPHKKRMRGIAVALYILCPVPLLILGNLGPEFWAIIGVCCLLATIAFATYLMVVNSKTEEDEPQEAESDLFKNLKRAVWSIAVALYLVVSFRTGAWHISWLIFPIAAAVCNLIRAILDLKEGAQHEK